MTTPTITEYLKYANLQMAAEAFLYDESSETIRTGARNDSRYPMFTRTAA